MARSILDIVIRLSKQGGADRETVKGLVQVKSSLSQLMGIAGAATGVLLTAKKAFDFAKEGAQLQFVEQRFNRLGATIGANSALLSNLRDVTRGLYSDTQLMTSASDLMGLGMAKSTDELERLMKVSSGLNMNMNQLVLTLANKTTMRFDQLGVAVDGFNEKMAGLEASGMSADDAFKEAFLQQAEAQLAKVGEAADSSAGAFMRLEASFANFSDQAKKNAAEGFAPLVEGMADALDSITEYSGKLDDVAGAGNWATTQAGAYNAALLIQRAELADVAGAFDQAHLSMQSVAALHGELSGAIEDTTAATFDFQASMTELDAIMGKGGIGRTYDDYQQTLAEIRGEQAEIQAELDKWTAPPEGSKKYQELIDKQTELEQKANDATQAFREQAAAIAFSVAQQQVGAAVEIDPAKALEGSQLLNQLATDYGLIDERQRQLMDSSALLVDQWAQGNASVYETVANLASMGSTLANVDLTNRELTSGTQLVNAELASSAAKYGDIAANAGAAGGSTQWLGTALQETKGKAETGAEGLDLINAQMTRTKSLANEGFQAVSGLTGAIRALDGMTATAVINIVVNGSVPNIGKGFGGMGGGGGVRHESNLVSGGPLAGGFARGGQLRDGQWAIVGDLPGGGWTDTTELITPDGFVIPNKVARFMMAAGLVPEGTPTLAGGGWHGPPLAGFLGGEGGAGGNYDPGNRRRVDVGVIASVSRPDTKGVMTTTSTPAFVETVTPLVETTEQAVASVEAAQVTQAFEARQTRATMAAGDAEQAALLREINSSIGLLNGRIGTTIRTAMAQAGG